MVTNDMDLTIQFWRDLLDLRLVARLGRPGYRHSFFKITAYDLIAFFDWPDNKRIQEKDHGVPVKGPVAFDHVSIEVQSDDDLWELKEKLEAADCWVSEVIDHGFIHSIYAFDPNNIPIEFSASVSGVDIRKNPKMRDKHPGRIVLEGSDPQPGQWLQPTEPIKTADRIVYPGEGMILVEDPSP